VGPGRRVCAEGRTYPDFVWTTRGEICKREHGGKTEQLSKRFHSGSNMGSFWIEVQTIVVLIMFHSELSLLLSWIGLGSHPLLKSTNTLSLAGLTDYD